MNDIQEQIESIVEEHWDSETFEEFEGRCLESLGEAMDADSLSVTNHVAQNVMQRTIESQRGCFNELEQEAVEGLDLEDQLEALLNSAA